MKRKLIISLCLSLLMTFFTTSALAQSKVVKGTVVDELGEPIIGATVRVAGTKTATVTDFDGNYQLDVPKNGKIVISYIGYKEATTTGGQLKLEPDNTDLEEVVVVGYGTQKMKNVTGAIETITPKEISDLSVGSLGDALAGQFNGVRVESSGSRPGQAPSLQIRQSSVATGVTPDATRGGDANPAPLYVIDGFISTEEAFNNLDVNEVESITVLKDAAAAVYGARAAYGVVLVKTKQGDQGAPKISYSGQFGWTNAQYTPKMLNSYDYMKVYNIMRAANTQTQDNLELRTQLFQKDEMEAARNINYDLLDKEWRAAFTQRHNININGGNEKATYFASVSYFDQDGNLGRLSYDRYNFRAGVNGKIGKYVKSSLQVSGDWGEKNGAVAPQGGGNDYDYKWLMTHIPFVPDFMDGNPIVYTGMENTTPTSATRLYHFGAVQNSSDNKQDKSHNMSINGSLEFDFSWIKALKGLTAKVSYSKNISSNKTNTASTILDVYGLQNRGGSGNHLYLEDEANVYPVYRLSSVGRLSRNMTETQNYQFNFTLQYARKFGEHDISGLFSIEKSEAETEYVIGTITDPIPYHDGQSNSRSINGEMSTDFNRAESGMLSYVGRLNYAYASKYLFEFLMRTDASTKFAPKNYWGFFPSISVGWVISEENWFKNKVKWIDFLKIRASWGLMGRDNIKAWLWTQLYERNAAKGAVFGAKGVSNPVSYGVLIPKAGVNSDVHWDKTYKTNIGIDARFLKSRLSVNFNYYYDRGRDLFAVRTGTTDFPSTVGTQATPENYGRVDSWGWELSLGWRDKIGKDWQYWVKLNTGYNDNKLLEDNFPAISELDSKVQGERADRGVWGYKCIGIFRSEQEIDEYFAKYNITEYIGNRKRDAVYPGMLIYEDVRGQNNGDGTWGERDGKIDKNDMIRISERSSNPYGFTMNFGGSWKSLSLTAQLSAAWGAKTLIQTDYRQAASDYEYTNMPSSFADMFNYRDIYDASGNLVVPVNRNASMPNMRYSDVNQVASTFWMINAATVSLRNITVAWTMPKQWVSKVGLSSVRLNLTVQNALDFYNPYPDKSWASYGGTYTRYPNLRKYTMGINVSF